MIKKLKTARWNKVISNYKINRNEPACRHFERIMVSARVSYVTTTQLLWALQWGEYWGVLVLFIKGSKNCYIWQQQQLPVSNNCGKGQHRAFQAYFTLKWNLLQSLASANRVKAFVFLNPSFMTKGLRHLCIWIY